MTTTGPTFSFTTAPAARPPWSVARQMRRQTAAAPIPRFRVTATGLRLNPMPPTWWPATPTARATCSACPTRWPLRSAVPRGRTEIMRFKSTKTLVVLLAVLAVSRVMAGNGEILYVNSFEGTGNVPQFVPVDEQATAAGRSLVIDVDTADPANQAGLSFSLVDAPAGMTIRERDGTIAWTPTQAQVGADSVTVRVEDLARLANTLTFGVQVVDPSGAPLIDPIAGLTIRVADPFALTVTAPDPDPGD